jgi:hypothetical protein
LEKGVIRCRLDLVIRLEDTTTGMPVGERGVQFTLNDKTIFPRHSGDGNYILVNSGRENGLMRANVNGYEPSFVYVDYEKLDEQMPSIDLFLIPSENMFLDPDDIFTLSGRLEGLTSLEAIHLGRPSSSTREYDPKRRILTIFMPNRRMNMIHSYYGIANIAQGRFEDITILSELGGKKVRIKEPLQEEFSPNSPIFRIIFGKVEEDGSYLLRVRNDGKNQKHLIRYVVNDEVRFKPIDFNDFDGTTLD